MSEPDSARRQALRTAAGALAGSALTALPSPTRADTRKTPGGDFRNYGSPSEQDIIRWVGAQPGVPGDGVSWTPLHRLDGTLTPNGLHFERHHNGVPMIDGDSWSLLVDGRVERALRFDLAALRRLPRRSRIAFIECSGNSNALWRPDPVQAPAGWLHGLLSASEWTGVPLSSVLEQVGARRDAAWLIAEGLDGAGVTVSLPLDSLPEHAMIALYQNGEPLRRAQGWPARLVLPGVEGIAQVKWLGRLHLADRPALSRFDTVAYTDLQPDGSARRFTRQMGVKSVVTAPALGAPVLPGFTEISGLAWSGAGRVQRVEISVDGGREWQDASLDTPVLDRALTRFRLPWRPAGEAIIASRATDQHGRRQPSHATLTREQGHNAYYHYNAVTGIRIDADGHVSHVHV